MTSNSEGHCNFPLLRTQPPTPSVYLPSLVENIVAENSLQSTTSRSIENIPQRHGRPQLSHQRPIRICRRLKRLISKQNTSTNIRTFATATEPRVCDEPSTPSENAGKRRCCCVPLHLSCLRSFCSSLSKLLGRLTGRRMPNENLFVLSMIQLLCGLAAVVLSGVAVTKVVFLYQMATGLWSGFLMLATGFHGILTARRCTPRTLVSLLIFCVLVALSACLLACVSVAGLIEDGILRPDTSITLFTASNSPFYLSSHGPSVASSSLPIDIPLGGFSHRRLVSSNQPPRLHQVMLHILLLVIGILEASVSVACAVLCCRQICPSDNAPPLSAITYLQNRGATLVPGGSEFLLAVAADPGRPAPVLLDYALPRPDLHPSVHHFLPHPGRRVVILTQAETGVHALAAAQAVASLVSPSSSRNTLSLPSVFASQRAQKREESHQLKAHLSTLLPRLASSSGDSAFRAAHPSNLLYVLSSPSPTDAPMIFPPFPPAYCSDEERGGNSISLPFPPQMSLCMHPQEFNIGPLSVPEVNPARNGSRRDGRRLGPRSRNVLGPRHHFRASRRSRRGSNAVDAVVGLLGDRILQPVLVVEDAETESRGSEESNIPPPSYTVSIREVSRPLPPTLEEA
ncbi:hypothetical protein ECG_07234 [Echinococcus granulosus]|uniref:Uncharacterized protein n=1 Tax=Echinococcus granulosus TaxID=6210 RepID=W6V1H2_ECHGR|nr:hypothetical protein EGR_05476 [Echinococcus granulosus]EUB59714.1 hypothetical protein EGR_05476 [Echinococcus granulosus]KAH9280740.1 hypothetical protein ECG_07234 [Echinococcus granulosus]